MSGSLDCIDQGPTGEEYPDSPSTVISRHDLSLSSAPIRHRAAALSKIATGCRVLRLDDETRLAQERWFVRVRPERKCPPSFESNLKNYQRTLSSLYKLNF